MKEYIEERAIQIANYIIDENATVRQTAKRLQRQSDFLPERQRRWLYKQQDGGHRLYHGSDVFVTGKDGGII